MTPMDLQLLETATAAEKKNEGWWRSFGLRWALIYFLCNVSGSVTWWSPQQFLGPYAHGSLLNTAKWFAKYTFGFRLPLTHQDYWVVFLESLAMVPLASAWTVFDRRKRSNAVIREVTYLLARFSLAAGMLAYATAKVIGYQGVFQPAPIDWLRPVGEISSGFMMWMWLGYSRVFEIFAGMNELIGGTLLLFRRTALLGALVVLPVMLYVTAMDTTFRVGPEALAAQFAFAALYLVLLQWRRLTNALVLQKPSAPPSANKFWNQPWLKVAARGVWVIVVAHMVWNAFYWRVKMDADIRGGQSALCGAYEVQRFVSDGRVMSEDSADPTRWRVLAVSRFADYIRVRRMDDEDLFWEVVPSRAGGRAYKYGDWQRYIAKTSGAQGELEIKPLYSYNTPHAAIVPGLHSKLFFTLHFVHTGPDSLSIEGKIDGAEISADLRRIDNSKIPFTWSQTLLP